MAQSVHLWLEIGGTHIKGEFPGSGPGREGSIECFSFYYGLDQPVQALRIGDSPTGQPTSARTHKPVTFHKRINKSTPLLLQALCQNTPVTKAEFRFFRLNPSGLRGDQHYFTVELEGGVVCGVKQVSEEATMAGRKDAQAIEEVSLTFARITWKDEITGAEHTDHVV